MTEDPCTVKHVPVYHVGEIIGSADIETGYIKIKENMRPIWRCDNLVIKETYQEKVEKHGYGFYVIVDSHNLGTVVYLGYPTINTNGYNIFPYVPEKNSITWEKVEGYVKLTKNKDIVQLEKAVDLLFNEIVAMQVTGGRVGPFHTNELKKTYYELMKND